jgi:hypothetical protein
MAYQAPDPAQFDTMKEGYAYLAPAAAVAITLPAFVFGGPCAKIAKIIYLRQCNPGEIVQGGAMWLQVAQQFDLAREAFQARLDALTPDQWTGQDRDAFNEKAQQILTQLSAISAFALHLGVSMTMIGFTLAILIPILVAVATVLFAMAATVLIVRNFVPAGPIMALAWRTQATVFATTSLAGLKTLEKVVDGASVALAGFIGANMTVTWVNMAAAGNIINPLNTLGSTVYSLAQGLLNLAFVHLMAPGKKCLFPNGIPAKILLGGVGVQGGYSFSNAIVDSADENAPNKMKEEGIDALTYDFFPSKWDDTARSGDAPHSWRNDGSIPESEEDGAQGTAGRS